jgi:hypothetical protein
MSIKIDRYQLLDTETGELLPYKPKGKHNKSNHLYNIHFPSIDEDIYDYILYYMTSSNISEVNKSDITARLKISDREYTREINDLIKKNKLIRLGQNKYFVNPTKDIKTSRTQVNRLKDFYLKAKTETQAREIEKLREPKQYAKRVDKYNKPRLLKMKRA